LGTSFNIKAYPDQKEIIVTVNNGQVQFYLKSADKAKIFLTAGEAGKFSSANRTFTKSINSNLNYASWETGIITFDKTKLSDALEVIQKQYNVNISFENNALGNCRITATFDNQSLDSILKMLEISFDIRVVNDGTITLIGNGCL